MNKGFTVKQVIKLLKEFDQDLLVGVESSHCDCGGFLKEFVVVGTKENPSYSRFDDEKVLILKDASI